jgi:hypothetical protein
VRIARNGEGFGRVPPLRSGPGGRASRAVGNDTAVANGAEPPARQAFASIAQI